MRNELGSFIQVTILLITMASQIRASMNRSPNLIPEAMTTSEQGQSIFASLKSEDEDASDHHIDAEVNNITSYYSPIDDNSLVRPSRPDSRVLNVPSPRIYTPPDQLPRALIVPNLQDPLEEALRRKCAFAFMDPIQKFIARRQTPWKLILQFAKIILITAQLLVFGQYRYAHTNYYSNNHVAFEHLFLKDWDPTREIHSYPPATGKYALYQKETFYEYFDYAAETFSKIENKTLVSMHRNSTLKFCINSYWDVTMEDLQEDLNQLQEKCIEITDKELVNFNSHKYLKEHTFTVPWDLLLDMRLSFSINTKTLKKLSPINGPECFNFRIDIKFDNTDHDGQVTIEMVSTPKHYACPTQVETPNDSGVYSIRILSAIVGLVCLTSFVLCCRALIRGQLLSREVTAFFEKNYEIKLTTGETMQFLNLWYVVICINDVLIIIGTILKEMIENERRTNNDLWDLCSTCLGVGNLLVWMGMLRYLGFFKKYNVIMLTVREAIPNILRFTCCLSIMYLGFVFCGWVVLGPYQFKFSTLSSTSECLFSLINGDDMFATYSMVSAKDGMIWGFSRLYLYLFIIIFIYVVLSLFIAIIMDSFEVVKEHYKYGFPKSRVDSFYRAVDYDVYSETFCTGFKPSWGYRIWSLVMMKRYGTQWAGHQRDHGGTSQNSSQTDEAPLIT